MKSLAVRISLALILLSPIAARADGPLPASAAIADAAEQQNRAKVQALLQQHADVNASQHDGMTALLWAAYHDDRETADLLLRAGANVKASNRYGVTPLSLACTNGNDTLVAALLKAGADPNGALPGGETPLMTAARTGSAASVRALLAAGAVVDAKDDRRGQTALMWAAAEGHADVVSALLDGKADYHLRVPSGFTPLLFAAREGRLDAVRVLLAAGADANEAIPMNPDRRRGYGGRLPPIGMSALMLAVSNAHFELAAALLDAGADPNVMQTGYTALHAITNVRRPGIGDNDPPPEGSGTLGSLELVKKLVARGANVNARMTRKVNLNNTRAHEIGATPFFLAALTDDTDLMKVLLEAGADPSLTNAEQTTPLIIAAGIASRSPGEDPGDDRETCDALKFLLERGADINAVDANGETAMHGAAYKNLPGAVRFLASKGAKVDTWNRPNKFGWTPLAIAAGYRFGNFKPSAETEAALREVMIAAGVKPPDKVTAVTKQIY